MYKIRAAFSSQLGLYLLLTISFCSIMNERTGLCEDVTSNEVFSLQINDFDSFKTNLLNPTNQISHMLLGQFSPEALGELYSLPATYNDNDNEGVKTKMQNKIRSV